MNTTRFELPMGALYIKPYWWEQIDFTATRLWMEEIWWCSLPISTFYIILIHWIQRAMRLREPMKLRGALLLWNLSLAVFSALAAIRTLTELMQFVGKPNFWHKSVCSRENQTVVSAFWSLLFTWSKVAELADTLFVVLRKQPLIFLHWYHHSTVLIFTWFTFPSMDPASRWFGGMNTFIHTIMYSYYAMKAFGMKIPKLFSMSLTTMQIAQMVVGASVNIYTFFMKWSGVPCDRRIPDVFLGTVLYLSYLILFSRFFYKAYMRKSPKKLD